jgi:hypothetical protein
MLRRVAKIISALEPLADLKDRPTKPVKIIDAREELRNFVLANIAVIMAKLDRVAVVLLPEIEIGSTTLVCPFP